ncbi:hypothetical protein EYC84_002971 [Monilinia fructicola]|uniref:Uncharacterized protein n=1 Tax=Monilinia fructicola TaxID=38448 RepID=A0A5M9JS70_MONFR|nr:hypothetical protein EYC84_002971 [Monilinia fructicola]
MPPRANPAAKSDDEKLLIAVLSQWDPLPAVDNHKLGAALGIKAGTAAASAIVGDPVHSQTSEDSSMAGSGATMTKKSAKGRRGNGNGKRPGMKGSVEQASATVTNTSQDTTAADSLGVGQAAVGIEKIPTTKPGKRGRKRAVVGEGSDESPVQRKKINKSIASSLNAATSKPHPSEGNKTNKYMGVSGGLGDYLKQEDGYFENSVGWPQVEHYDPFRGQGDELDEFQLSGGEA